MEDILIQIRDFADNAHGTQTRKFTPERYIVHPIRVMETCREYDDRLPVLAAALLHDVLEDTPVSRDDLSAFLRSVLNDADAAKTLILVEEMTDVYIKADYPRLNRKQRKQHELDRIVLTSSAAQTIKYADILDNSTEISAQDPDFAPRYLQECLAILQKADKVNRKLYDKVRQVVLERLNDLNSNNTEE